MRRHTVVVLCVAFVVLSLASCRKEGGDGKKRPEPRGPIGQLLEIRRMLADPSYQYRGVPPHERLGWKAEEFFTDPKVIELCKAIEAKDLTKIDELVKSGVDVNARGRGNMTPLLWAFPMGEEVFRRLLEHGADPNVQLTEQIRPGLDPGESVTYISAGDDDPIHEVFYDTSTENYLELVLEHGGNANLEMPGRGTTPLFNVSYGKNGVKKVGLLLAAGADINHIDVWGGTALMPRLGDTALALLEAGADYRIVDCEGNDFILLVGARKARYPAEQETLARVRGFLANEGCDVEAVGRARGHLSIDPKTDDGGFDGRKSENLLARREKVGNRSIPAHLRPWLRPKGRPHERVRWKAEDFFTDPKVIELCKAIEAEDLVEIDELVQSGVDVNARGRANMTPLLWAFPMGEKVFRRLLEHGADPNVKLTERIYPFYAGDSVTFLAAGPSPSHVCIFHDVSMDNYLKLVLEHGGDANLQNGHGRTPLFAAVTAFEDSERRIRLLLEAGADIDHQDVYGDTPAMFAERHRRYDSLLVLLNAGANLRLVNKSGIDVVFMVGRRLNLTQGRAENDTPVVNWLKQQGYDLEAARKACEGDLPLRGVPIDQRPWLNRDLAGDSPARKE